MTRPPPPWRRRSPSTSDEDAVTTAPGKQQPRFDGCCCGAARATSSSYGAAFGYDAQGSQTAIRRSRDLATEDLHPLPRRGAPCHFLRCFWQSPSARQDRRQLSMCSLHLALPATGDEGARKGGVPCKARFAPVRPIDACRCLTFSRRYPGSRASVCLCAGLVRFGVAVGASDRSRTLGIRRGLQTSAEGGAPPARSLP